MNPAEIYILHQPEPYRSMLMHLQLIIEQTVPEVALKYKYKIPFYYLDEKPFCYLNQSKNYVDLGFWNAAHLSVHTNKMITAGRKIMKSLRYKSLSEIDDLVLKEVLLNACEVSSRGFWK
jgi:hypothetical protein